jgi:calcium-dependent protein kinase
MGEEDILKMFDAVDIDKSGSIDYSEFVVAAMSEKQLLTDEKLLTTFKMFDKVCPPFSLTILN